LARTKGGLSSVATAAGAKIISETVTAHTGLGTSYALDANPGSVIDNGKDGWIALATIPDSAPDEEPAS
jgi:hypothetical protein